MSSSDTSHAMLSGLAPSSITSDSRHAGSENRGAALSPTIEYCSELQRAWEHFTSTLIDVSMPPCLITLRGRGRTRGYYCPERFGRVDGRIVDEIAMNPARFGIQPLKETLSTLAHEITHAWQFHHGAPGRRGYHNVEWADFMESIGLMPSHTGEPGGKRLGEQMTHYVIPGGRFDVACDVLLDSSFQLSWFDRFPPITAAALASLIAGGDDNLAGSDGQDAAPLVSVASMLVVPAEDVNTSNRYRYTCPICGDNIWGKGSIQAGCFATPECRGARFESA